MSLRPYLSIVYSLPLVTCSMALHAQEYRGTLQGSVTDSKGYELSHATVEAKSNEQDYTVTTDAKGYFVIPFVQPGTYTVTVQAENFRTEVRKNVILDIAQKIDLSMHLTPGGVNETVSVTSEPIPLSLTDASGGTVMDPEKVQDLPLNGRQVYSLLALTPGVRFTQTQFGAGGYSGTRGWDTSNAYSISGQQGFTNQFYLNGAPISVQGGGGAGTWNLSPTIDAVQEFKIMTITFDSQYGRVGGGAVNTTIKNGTPHFHGTVYDFWRNSIFDANLFRNSQLGVAKPYHNQHQFGGTVGGPFLKHDAFFFFSYEGWREVLPAGLINSTVPTPDLFPDGSGNVNLTNYLHSIGKGDPNNPDAPIIFDPNTTRCADAACSHFTRTPFPNNTIPADRISSLGLKLLSLFPAPNRPGYQNNFVSQSKDTYRYNMPIARVDYNFTDRTRLYGIFAWWAGHENRNGNGFSGPLETGNIQNYRSSITQVLDLTHTFSSHIVGDVRLSFNRFFQLAPNGSLSAGTATLSAADLGLNMPHIPTTSHDYAPQFSFGDGLTSIIGNVGDPSIFETYDLGPSVTQTIGRHTLHYGGEVSLYHDISGGVGQPNGTFSFGTNFTQQDFQTAHNDGSTVAELLLGIPNGGSVQYNFAPYESYNYYGFFGQDDWKVTDHFAINAGLRWDEELSPKERHNRLLAGICLTCVNPLSGQVSIPGHDQLLGAVQFASNDLSAYSNNTGYFQPKLGLSYSPNNKLVFHGGYTISKAVGIELGGSNPFGFTTDYNSTPDGGRTPSNFFNSGTPFPNGFITPPGAAQGGATFNGTGIGVDQRDRKIPIVQQYTFGLQMQLPFGIVADAAYLAAHTTHYRSSRQYNGLSPEDFARGHADPNYLNQQVPNPFYGVLDPNTDLGRNPTIQASLLKVPYPQYNGNLYIYTDAGGYSHYNALLAKVDKRITGGGALTKGLSFIGSFTWSKTESAYGLLNNGGAGLVDPKPYKAIDGIDRPWDFAFSGLYGLPIGSGGALFANTNSVVRQLISNWQLDWIFTNSSGSPVGYPNGNNYNCGTYNIRPAQRSYKSYLNNSDPGCFTNFEPYTAITQKPITAQVRSPYASQTQIAVEKKFDIRESMKLQFKLEAFNVTNTPIFGGPDTGNPLAGPVRQPSVGDPNQPGAWSGYGTIGNTQQNFPRQMQASLKLYY